MKKNIITMITIGVIFLFFYCIVIVIGDLTLGAYHEIFHTSNNTTSYTIIYSGEDEPGLRHIVR